MTKITEQKIPLYKKILSWAKFILILAPITLLNSILMAIALPFNFKNRAMHKISQIWSFMLIFASGMKIHTEGLENIEKNKSYIIASNHQSYLDIPALFATIRQQALLFVLKEELTKIPIWGWILKPAFISVKRGSKTEAAKSLNQAKKKIYPGSSVMIFPEGTRSEDLEIDDFKKGAFYLARQFNLDIIPVSIHGTGIMNPKGKSLLQNGHVYIKVDKLIKTNDYKGAKKNLLQKDTKEIIKKNLDELKKKYIKNHIK